MITALKLQLVACMSLLFLLAWALEAKSQEMDIPRGSYEMQVMPDTVDLTRSADLAMNAITRCTNPDDNYSVYFHGNITVNPVRLVGNEPDSVVHWKLTEPLLLLRLMTGNRANLEVDRAWTSSLHQLPAHIPQTHPVHLGRGLAAVSVLYAITGDNQWRKLGVRIVDRLNEICIRQEDFSYFPVIMEFLADPTRTISLEEYDEPFPTGWPAMHDAWLVEGLVAFYQQSGYQPALDLAGQLARHMRYHGKVFGEDGQFIAAHNGSLGPGTAIHFHRHTNVLLALLDYAIASRETDYAEFVRMGYEYARRQGNVNLGFFPEYIPGAFPDDRHGIVDCEGCCVADMTLLALNLSACGAGNYWEDVDRYSRNMLTEMQLKSTEAIERRVEGLQVSPVDHSKEDSHQAIQRLVGSFAGWSGPNEFRVWGPGVMQCCLVNCGRALYFVWDRILEEEGETLTVNLFFNRVSEAAVVRSFLPYEGRVEILLTKSLKLKVRLPGWMDRSSIHVVNHQGETVEHFLDDTYLNVDSVSNAEVVELQFDLPEREVTEQVGHLEARITYRGNEVVQFEPAGKENPYWIDKHVELPICPEATSSYFVPASRYEPLEMSSDSSDDLRDVTVP